MRRLIAMGIGTAIMLSTSACTAATEGQSQPKPDPAISEPDPVICAPARSTATELFAKIGCPDPESGETQLPDVTQAAGWEDPQTLRAFLAAVRLGTVASADDTLQARSRVHIAIEEYQLEPVAEARACPGCLLIVDDIGPGKTIEAGLVVHDHIDSLAATGVLAQVGRG